MQEQNHSIKHWVKDDRPREKLLSKSPMAPSDSELFVILINSGTKNKSAVELAREVMELGKNNLAQLGKLSVKELMKIKGIGEAKAVTVAAALELERRRQGITSLEKPVVKDSREIANYLQVVLRDHHHEVFAVVLF
ncbi:MAG TPA: UPF0758 domain-containing protein [Puia sp.]